MTPTDSQPAPPTIYHLVLYQADQDSLTRRLASEVGSLMDANVTSAPRDTEINLWLDSPGGDAHAAYKIYLDIRCRCNKFRVVVPDYAKSAATLLVLGADELLMGPTAELGPLDAQMEHPDREGKIVSALDAVQAVNYLVELASSLALSAGPEFIRLTGLPRSEVLRELLRFMSRFLNPMVAKLDPQLVYHARNDLRVAEEYAVRLLRERRGPGDNDMQPSVRPEVLATRLVSEYPEHGFVISRNEASKLGLAIKNAEDHPRWSKLKSLNKTVSWDRQESFLEVLEDSELDERDYENKEDNNNADGEDDAEHPR